MLFILGGSEVYAGRDIYEVRTHRLLAGPGIMRCAPTSVGGPACWPWHHEVRTYRCWDPCLLALAS